MNQAKRTYIVKGYMGGNGILQDNLMFNTYAMDSYPIFDAVVEKEVNKSESFKFTMGSEHPFISMVQAFRNWVLLIQYAGYIDDDQEWHSVCEDVLFYGRVVDVEDDLYGNKTVQCEGAIGFLNDIHTRIKDFGIDGLAMNQTMWFLREVGRQQRELITEADAPENAERIDQGDLSPLYLINSSFKSIYENLPDPEQPGQHWFTDIDNITIYETSAITDIRTDSSVINYLDLINDNIIDIVGGAVYTRIVYDGTASSPITVGETEVLNYVRIILCYRADRTDFGMGIGTGGFARYNWPADGDIDSDSYPRFILGENVINMSKEQALETIFSGVFPVGKDGLLLTDRYPPSTGTIDYDSNYIWHEESAYDFGRIAITLDLPNVVKPSDLYELSYRWLSKHTSDNLRNVYKYTVTGPEPIVIGYGNYFVRPMGGVLYSEELGVSPEDTHGYTCLSMKIDVFNPGNNQYTFGPFVSDNYSDTSITEKTAKNSKKGKGKKKK